MRLNCAKLAHIGDSLALIPVWRTGVPESLGLIRDPMIPVREFLEGIAASTAPVRLSRTTIPLPLAPVQDPMVVFGNAMRAIQRLMHFTRPRENGFPAIGSQSRQRYSANRMLAVGSPHIPMHKITQNVGHLSRTNSNWPSITHLCNLLGADVESGAVPNDDSLIGPMVKNICEANAKAYLGLARS